MIIITLQDNDYNKLPFRFNDPDVAIAFVEMALDHGGELTALIEKEKEDKEEEADGNTI